ncbi:Tad domain-containing protein [Aurantiacibacter gangjinensis]|nr:Tad domain-containing protein [Aurantiacibacter gangjinensis]APE28567.1 hypothetical protein BMF35_a1738 [Aurantiacibacter gangjinensis]
MPTLGTGFFKRLRDDTRGNTLMFTAAVLIPLVAVVGGGLDASRIYLAQSRLQQACDSAALAARQELGGATIANGEIPQDIRDTADAFFANNFRSGMYGTNSDTFALSAQGDSTMHGDATVKVPTTLMAVFGHDEVDVVVECSAELNLPNIDVVMVLDMSGSMRGQRVRDLRAAVFDFYDEVMAAAPVDARIRIGVVPYSGAVNVGQMLLDENPDYLTDSFTYQSREALFRQVSNNDAIEVGDRLDEESGTFLLPRNSAQLGSTNSAHYHWNKNSDNHEDRCDDYEGTYTVGEWTYEIDDTDWRENYWSGWPNDQKAACEADITRYRVADADDVRVETFRDVFDGYRYAAIDFDTTLYKRFQTVSTPTGTQGAMDSSRWNGCIEERQTVAQTTFDPIPAAAYDLDIDMIPNPADPETQWRPMWPDITFNRAGPDEERTNANRQDYNHPSWRRYNCPDPALRLTAFPLDGASRNADFEDYINDLDPGGGTMHDIGMIWAGRLISPDGIFGADNRVAPNGDPIARHIIFMTDGEMGANPTNTTAYGNADMDGRLAGFAPNGRWTENQTAAIHNQRLEAICRSIRNKNVTIWTVSFELELNDFTRGCSTGTGRAFEADDADELSDAFRRIASSIAELRLVE